MKKELREKIKSDGLTLAEVLLLPEREVLRRYGKQAVKDVSLSAVLIVEGVLDLGDTEEEKGQVHVAAWQSLINTGLVWQLQGWFGRRAAALIEEGLCKSAPRT